MIPAGTYQVDADVTLPDTVSIGLRQRVNEAFTAMAGLEWTNWSRIKTVPFDGSPAGTSLALDFQDGWFFSLGGSTGTIRPGPSVPALPMRSRRP